MRAGARFALGLLLLLAPACASSRGGAGASAPASGSAPAAAPASTRFNSDIIYPDEIAAAGVGDAYDAIMRLRPRFLAPRGTGTTRRPEGVQVVVDGRTLSSSSELRQVTASSIVYIRYLSAMEASTNWGGRFDAPVVYVLTRAGPPG